ncbi:MAG: cytochrome c biogenesis protein CcsA [Pseudomonadota bacterium]
MSRITSILFLGALAVIFFYAPIEKEQGVVQKIFYIHVSSAITMYLGYGIAFLAALMFLLGKSRIWDEVAVSAAEVGFFLNTAVLLTGPFWAKATWGAWWVWDPRITSTALMWLLYAAYLVMRSYLATDTRGRTITSVLLVVDLLVVPLVHFSVKLWRGMHPPQGILTPRMLVTMAVTIVAVLLLGATLFRARFRLERSRTLLESVQLKASENS